MVLLKLSRGLAQRMYETLNYYFGLGTFISYDNMHR